MRSVCWIRPGTICLWACGVVLLLGLLLPPRDVAAHTGTPVKQERVQAGPYTLDLRYYSTPRAGQNLLLLLVPVGAVTPTTIRVSAAPGPGVSATAARISTAPDPDQPSGTDALIPLAATGLWIVTIAADGPAGVGEAELAVIAASPGAVPVPVGWALGLSPLGGIIAFAVAQRRWLRAATAG